MSIYIYIYIHTAAGDDLHTVFWFIPIAAFKIR